MTNSTKVLAAMGIVAGLGVAAALPVTGHAADVRNATTEVNATISETISISNVTAAVSGAITNGGGAVELTNGGAAGKFTITSNSVTGYTVTALAGTKAGTDGTGTETVDKNLTSGDNKTIPYSDSTLTTSDSGWQVQYGESGSATILPLATTGSNTFITESGTTAGTEYTVHYYAAASPTQEAGTYTGHVTYTVAKKS